MGDVAPPFPGASGYWVDSFEFTATKGFGWFECWCHAKWISAQSQPSSRFRCRKCGFFCKPLLMWENTGSQQGNRRRKNQKKETNWSPPPPFPDAQGAWVLLEDFEGEKSFGWFKCNARCNAKWISAHAQREFRQGCKRCNIYRYPTWLWVNNPTYERDFDDDDGEKQDKRKPHLSHLCEACKKGKCNASGGYGGHSS
eukprot:Selendium_serpulae@DN2491_c0_g1_i1.p1